MDTLDDYRTHIAKRKRTKRQRPKSPMPFSIADTHSMSGDSNGDNFNSVTSNAVLSPVNSSELAESTTEEEEEMANCLILLARGNYSNQQSSIGCDHGEMGMKFTSKRISKMGNYVYQCQTCDRTFPSFQALGGHRASHKKSMNKQLSDEEKGERFKASLSSPDSVPLQLINGNGSFHWNSNGSSKFHECKVCGAEFASGQALGGHMSRHRTHENCYEAKGERSVLSLDLDLNLPAPESDHERESKFSFAPEKKRQPPKEKQLQQSALVLSTAPAWVDCRY